MNPTRLAAFLFLAALLTASSCLAFADYAGKVPSCNDQIATTRTAPGTAECTPAIFDRNTALKFMEGRGIVVRKIKDKWYLFLSEEDLKKFDAGKRWQALSLLVSSVQSLFGRTESCYLARIPRTDAEKNALLAGTYPPKLIAASAKAVPFGAKSEKDYNWPQYHHHVLYRLTVY